MGRVELGGGWDSSAALVDGVWLERTARRADVEPWLRTETRLLPWLAPRIPLPVPHPEVVGEDPLVVRHRIVPGAPAAEPPPALGTEDTGDRTLVASGRRGIVDRLVTASGR